MDKSVIAVILSFVLYTLYILLPLIPSFLIYRFFPDTEVHVKGRTLSGLKIKAGGAFAAYIITASLGFSLVQNTHKQILKISPSTWTLTGKVELKTGKEGLRGIRVKYIPEAPQTDTAADGQFSLKGVKPAFDQKNKIISISINKGNKNKYETISNYNVTAEKIKIFDEGEEKTINIPQPIKLDLKPEEPSSYLNFKGNVQ